LNAFLWIVRKDLAVFFADKKGAMMVILVPLLLGLLMGTIFAPSDGPSPITVVVADEDGGAQVAALVERLGAEPSIEIERTDAAAARAGVESGNIGVAIHFASGTSDKLSAAAMFGNGDRGGATLWVDPSRAIEADIVAGLLTKAMMETVFSQISDPSAQREMFEDLRSTMGPAADRPELAAFLDQGMAFSDEAEVQAGAQPVDGEGPAPGMQPPLDVSVESVVAGGPTSGFNSYAHTFAGMLMQFLLFSAATYAKGLFAERSAGTLDRVRMTRAGPTTILLGTATAVAIICLLATAVIFGVGVLFFDIQLGSGLPAFIIVAMGQAMFVGSFALLLAGLANSDKQLDSVATLVILFLCFVSGAWVPSFMLPHFFEAAGPLIPTRWVLDGMAGATWRGLGIGHALQCFGALFGFSAVFAAIGIKRFRWS
jgi:ABC-2 type transport system permease protein